jgi:hypothetical protein
MAIFVDFYGYDKRMMTVCPMVMVTAEADNGKTSGRLSAAGVG